MGDILSLLSSPQWWISVVIAGLLVNLASAYAKPLIDGLWSRLSTRRRTRLEQEQRELDHKVQLVLEDAMEFDYLAYLVVRTWCQIITLLVLWVALLITTNPDFRSPLELNVINLGPGTRSVAASVVYTLGNITILAFYVRLLRSASRNQRLLRAVRRTRRSLRVETPSVAEPTPDK